jgi:hypothetical protein
MLVEKLIHSYTTIFNALGLISSQQGGEVVQRISEDFNHLPEFLQNGADQIVPGAGLNFTTVSDEPVSNPLVITTEGGTITINFSSESFDLIPEEQRQTVLKQIRHAITSAVTLLYTAAQTDEANSDNEDTKLGYALGGIYSLTGHNESVLDTIMPRDPIMEMLSQLFGGNGNVAVIGPDGFNRDDFDA